MRRRRRWRLWISAALAMSACVAVLVAVRQLTRINFPSVPVIDLHGSLVDETPVTFPVVIGGLRVTRRTTIDELGTNILMWRSMHLADWNGVPRGVRARSLDQMFDRYRRVLISPRVWDAMQPRDWDLVPQPMRTVAYRQMVAYWTGYYRLGGTHGLSRRLVSQTLAAIIMSESWFEHRALVINADGSRDIGLAQASDFARNRVRELFRLDAVDINLADDDYENPWLATRFAAVWMSLLLDEAGGDLDLATRAYHRGLADAGDERGAAYLEAVQRRLERFIRNRSAPPAWDYVWRRARQLEQLEWPWTVDDRSRFAPTVVPRARGNTGVAGYRPNDGREYCFSRMVPVCVTDWPVLRRAAHTRAIRGQDHPPERRIASANQGDLV